MRGKFAGVLLGAWVSSAALAAAAPPGGGSTPTAAAGTPAAAGTATAGKKAGGPGTSWASIAKLPDWSGVWELDWQRRPNGLAPPSLPKLTPEYAAKQAKYKADQSQGERQQTDTANCNPPGMPQIMTQPYPVEFLFTPGKVTVAIEAYSQMRRIFVDGRPHLEDPDPTYQGDSIGHWEGDTLVVDTIGFIPNSYIAPGINHSDAMRIEERIRRLPGDTMEIKTTIYDSKALAEPWTATRFYERHTDWDIKEYVCTENNRDSADPEGRAGINLKR